MKKVLLFAVALTIFMSLSVCYAGDTPEGYNHAQTIKVLKKIAKGHGGKDSTYAEVSLKNVEKDCCYYCHSDSTWHIYTFDSTMIYQGGEIDDKGNAINWCRIKQDTENSVFVADNNGLDNNFTNNATGNGKPYSNRNLTIAESPKLYLLDDNKESFSTIQFHHIVNNKTALQSPIEVTVFCKDAKRDSCYNISITKDTTTLSAGSKIDSIRITKNRKNALVLKSIRCGNFKKDNYIGQDFLHINKFSEVIQFSDMGISEGAPIQLKIIILTLDDNCKLVEKELTFKIATDNHSNFTDALTSPLAKTIGIVIVLLLVIFCVLVCVKSFDRNKRETAPEQSPRKNRDNHNLKSEPDKLEVESIVEKQKGQIECLKEEKKKHEKKIEDLKGQLRSMKGDLDGKNNQIEDLNRKLTAKDEEIKSINEELAKYKVKLSEAKDYCEHLKRSNDNLKSSLQNLGSEFRKREKELTDQNDELSKAINTQRDEFIKELKDKDVVHEKEVRFIRDEHLKEIDSIRQENKNAIEALTVEFNVQNKMYADDSQWRMEGGRKLLEEIFEDVNGLSSSALSTSAYGQWIERMLDGDSSNSLPVFYEVFTTGEPSFEAYRRIRTLIESSISDVGSWINTLARLASYVSSEAVASDMQKDGADIKLLGRAFDLMKVFMTLYGYQCIVPKLFTSTVEECSGEFVRDNTDLFINRISGAVFKDGKTGVVCDLGSVACVKLVDSSDGNRLVKGKINSL